MACPPNIFPWGAVATFVEGVTAEALLKLFRHRWGNVLPDDDAGRDDLWLLVTNVSLAAVEPEKKMHHVRDVGALDVG